VVAVEADVTHAYAVRQDGTVWGWGSDQQGQLGSGQQNIGSRVPVQLPDLTAITQVVATQSAGMALDAEGQVWTWGSNSSGQLGIDELGGIRAPRPIGALGGVSAIYSAFSGARAVR
jgi:alpha-tubulin suppressor-like RCC1 family protein